MRWNCTVYAKVPAKHTPSVTAALEITMYGQVRAVASGGESSAGYLDIRLRDL
jgi:hypothetical protein